MKISIVMPSYLGNYPGCASDRVAKLHRAIQSVINQYHEDWELIIIADGCVQTIEEVSKYADKRIKSFIIPKQTGFGIQRNPAIKEAKGEVICYLDSDDMLSPLHLDFIRDQIKDNDWIWFHHYELKNGFVTEKKANINHAFSFGTCNFAHKLRVYWLSQKYGYDDLIFLNTLKSKSDKFSFAGQGYYINCHINKITGNGFES